MTATPMQMIELDAENAIHTIYHPPGAKDQTFVFLNSMGATTDAWEAKLAPMLREQGYGTLSFDYRGQGKTRYGADAKLEPEEIISDIVATLKAVKPRRPVLVGLSIGGLFGAHAVLRGAQADGIVFINTLRKANAQVEWINTLEARLIAMGGMPLVLDVLRPVLSGREELARLRPTHLPAEGYTPWPPEHPRRRLAEGVNKADWSLPYEQLTLPTLVLTGLHDRLFRIQEDVDEIVARLPDATVVTYPDGGHSLQAEFPERFIANISAFAGRLKKA
ncbi:alpha/beta hydrolase [Pseudotabrizicola sediminis]|uniref:Alpha/beta hydrolase n=1 Tax=Pseudotabrizicola sediminis TaxID=2486418 RepID=A0ABY2KLC8_9RHOB|nr:alpha/beta hydrolase [Pseudotabrizicola sediminis]TGD41745.1 alpha/beta hydrolase [Pseudotabrizicola sediminis]